MNVSTRCVLKKLTDTSAEIGLIGKIVGSATPVSFNDGVRNLRIILKDGHCAGQCTIDRRTGLPTQSEVIRYLEMIVQLPDGSEIPQRKEVLTTITSFPDQGGTTDSAVGMSRESGAGQLARTSGFGVESESSRVTHADASQGDHNPRTRGTSSSRR